MPLFLNPPISRAHYRALKKLQPDLTFDHLDPDEAAAFHAADLLPNVLLEPNSTTSAYLVESVVHLDDLRPPIYRSTRIAATAKLWRGQGGATDGQEYWRLPLRCGSVPTGIWNEETEAIYDVVMGQEPPAGHRHPYYFLTLPWDRHDAHRIIHELYRLHVNVPDVFSIANPGLTPEDLTEITRIIAA